LKGRSILELTALHCAVPLYEYWNAAVRNKTERVQLERQIRKYQRFLMHIPDEQFQRTAKEEIAELQQKLREMDE
jgi:hypothetical protein